MTPIGYIHVACSEGYFGFTDLVPRVAKLCPELGEADLAELQRLLDSALPADRLAKTRPPEGEVPDEPSLDRTADVKLR